LNILLVEDLPLNQKIAIEFMAMDEHKVKLADDGQSALAMMQKHEFDLVLLDMNLPDFNGQEVLKRLKVMEHKNQRTPILAFTASLSPDEIKEYLALGIKDIVGKPIKLEKLRRALHNSQKTQAPSLSADIEPILFDKSAAKTLSNSFSEDELSSVYNDFVLSARTKQNRCQELLASDSEQCIKILHRQASTALQLGFNLYGLALKKIERKLLDGKVVHQDLEQTSDLWQKSLTEYLKDVRKNM
jgi:CheY-like chemotaxis protein